MKLARGFQNISLPISSLGMLHLLSCSIDALVIFFPCVIRTLLEKELETCGIRLNSKKPNIYFKASNNFYLIYFD